MCTCYNTKKEREEKVNSVNTVSFPYQRTWSSSDCLRVSNKEEFITLVKFVRRTKKEFREEREKKKKKRERHN